jgi:dolichol-phosphate mannosyltransferase
MLMKPECSDLAAAAAELTSRVDIAVVLPTFNERDNVAEVIGRLSTALTGLSWELIFVDDDSPDGTAEAVRAFAARDRRIRLIQRIGRRGLSSACVEGMLATTANCIAVMDADLQHDETILPLMLEKLRSETVHGAALDIVVGTRNADGGSMGEFSQWRVRLSQFGRKVSRGIAHCEVTDPMSGYFILRRSFFLEVVHNLYGGGFKILLDMLATSTRPVLAGEVGYCFRKRIYGQSKLDVNTALEYLFLVTNKMTGGSIPTRFVLFALVGTSGLVVNFALLWLLYQHFHLSFWAAQAWSTIAAMTCNFILNNLITYRDRSLRGIQMFTGMLTFMAACSFGAWANVSFADSLLHAGVPWYLAGLAGTVLSAVWNYSVSNLFTWQRPQPSRPIALPAQEERLNEAISTHTEM